MGPFPRFVALCDHNLPTLHTDGQTNRDTDVMLVDVAFVTALIQAYSCQVMMS